MLTLIQAQGITLVTVLSPVGIMIVGLAGLYVTHRSNRRLSEHNKHLLEHQRYIEDLKLKEQKHTEERKEIYKKLNSFYGPALFLLDASRELYERFTLLRDDDFRTLVALLEGEEFVGNDAVLLEQIFEVTKALEVLIYAQSGLVEDKELQELLAKGSAHFRIIRLAYSGNLSGEKERFENDVFPRELTPRLEKQTAKLRSRLAELNKAQ